MPRTSRRTSRAVTIRSGLISAPGFKAQAYRGSNPAFRGRIAVERGSGMIEFPSLAQLPRILREEGISSSAAEQAFGKRRMRANGDDGMERERVVFGMKRAKIGHIGPKGVALGSRKGSLLLVDTKDAHKILWGAVEDPPGTIRSFTSNRVTSLDGVFSKAREFKIPPQAVYDAFGHMMDAADRKALLKSFHTK